MFSLRKKLEMPSADEALPGRSTAIPTARTHFVNGHTLKGPYPDGLAMAMFGLGCFWGAERKFWELGDAVYVTAVGYAGGLTPEPDLRGSLLRPHRAQRSRAGGLRSEEDFLRAPAQDVLGKPRPDAGHAPGRRRRYPIPLRHLYVHAGTARRRRSLEGGLRQGARRPNGWGRSPRRSATPPPFYFAEDYHQQYLAKIPTAIAASAAPG